MKSKTPNFDAKLEKIYSTLVPHERECVKCKIQFPLTHDAIEFYKKVHVPPPTHCWECRRQRRLTFLNFTSLFKRKCDMPGHTDEFISTTPNGSRFPMYEADYFDSNAWDPFQYTHAYDPSQTFFSQFTEFHARLPWYGVKPFKDSIDSEYTFSGGALKYCYYVMGGRDSENVYYANWAFACERGAELLIDERARDVYNVVLSYDIANCQYTWFSKDCMDSFFLYDCRNCSSCFGCVGLRSKKNCFFNEQLSKADYEKKIAEIDLGNYDVREKTKKGFNEFIKKVPIRGTYLRNTNNCVGNFMDNSKECYMMFDGVNSERCSYVDVAAGLKDTQDLAVGGRSELLYECAAVGKGAYQVVFSAFGSSSKETAYVFDCKRCSNCFGCVGLRDKSFCIFNVQYTEEEYWPLLDKISSDMLDLGEYGEFFPMTMAPYPYDASLAQVIYPLDEASAKEQGLWWYGEDKIVLPKTMTVREAKDIPASITEVTDAILNEAIRCPVSGRLYRIVKAELEFYRRYTIPVPRVHPRVRMLERFKDAGNFRLQEIECDKCSKKIWSMKDPMEGYKVYCDECYQQEIL